ncbi:NUDIX hydrolase (plasmid) [Nonomuraea sp. NBC_00507]|uniref:NUDIX hydrolase n=1 Tax=Nonomuraea sp. NBC_00507 TaxID=2976002 RepID=UPI002E19049B
MTQPNPGFDPTTLHARRDPNDPMDATQHPADDRYYPSVPPPEMPACELEALVIYHDSVTAGACTCGWCAFYNEQDRRAQAEHGGETVRRCDNTRVGVLVRDSSSRLLVIDRATPPGGVTGLAGHLDEHAVPEKAARDAVLKEVGLQAVHLDLLVCRWREDRCRRQTGPEGIGHEWHVYQARADGAPSARACQAFRARWLTRGQLQALVVRTAAYARGELPDAEWWASPGIAPVWVFWLSLAGLVTATREDLAAIEQASSWQVRT